MSRSRAKHLRMPQRKVQAGSCLNCKDVKPSCRIAMEEEVRKRGLLGDESNHWDATKYGIPLSQLHLMLAAFSLLLFFSQHRIW